LLFFSSKTSVFLFSLPYNFFPSPFRCRQEAAIILQFFPSRGRFNGPVLSQPSLSPSSPPPFFSPREPFLPPLPIILFPSLPFLFMFFIPLSPLPILPFPGFSSLFFPAILRPYSVSFYPLPPLALPPVSSPISSVPRLLPLFRLLSSTLSLLPSLSPSPPLLYPLHLPFLLPPPPPRTPFSSHLIAPTPFYSFFSFPSTHTHPHPPFPPPHPPPALHNHTPPPFFPFSPAFAHPPLLPIRSPLFHTFLALFFSPSATSPSLITLSCHSATALPVPSLAPGPHPSYQQPRCTSP